MCISPLLVAMDEDEPEVCRYPVDEADNKKYSGILLAIVRRIMYVLRLTQHPVHTVQACNQQTPPLYRFRTSNPAE